MTFDLDPGSASETNDGNWLMTQGRHHSNLNERLELDRRDLVRHHDDFTSRARPG